MARKKKVTIKPPKEEKEEEVKIKEPAKEEISPPTEEKSKPVGSY